MKTIKLIPTPKACRTKKCGSSFDPETYAIPLNPPSKLAA